MRGGRENVLRGDGAEDLGKGGAGVSPDGAVEREGNQSLWMGP